MNPSPRDPQQRTDAARRHFYQVWMLIGVCILFYVLGFLLDVLATPVSILAWTIVFVLVLQGPVAWLEEHGIKRGLGTAIAYAGMAAVITALVILMCSPAFGVSDQFASMAAALPDYVNSLTTWATGMYERYAYLLQNDTVREWIDTASVSLADWASATAKQSASGVVLFGTGLANAVMEIGFALVVAFWLLMELPALSREIDRLVAPSRKEDVDMFRLACTRIMGGYLKATLLQCFIIGLVCGICFAIIGIPNAAALGLITGVLNIIPVVGPWIGGAVAAVVGLFVSPFASILALALTVVVQQFVYTFVSPKLMSDSVDVHPAVVIVALFVGSAVGSAMGGLVGSIVGMLLSIPFAAILKTVFVYYFERRTGRQVVAEDGVMFRGKPTASADDENAPDAMADAMAPALHKPVAPPAFLSAFDPTLATKQGAAEDAEDDGEASPEENEDDAR